MQCNSTSTAIHFDWTGLDWTGSREPVEMLLTDFFFDVLLVTVHLL